MTAPSASFSIASGTSLSSRALPHAWIGVAEGALDWACRSPIPPSVHGCAGFAGAGLFVVNPLIIDGLLRRDDQIASCLYLGVRRQVGCIAVLLVASRNSFQLLSWGVLRQKVTNDLAVRVTDEHVIDLPHEAPLFADDLAPDDVGALGKR